MQSLIHLPLERYKERYTENLDEWEARIFTNYFAYEYIAPRKGKTLLNIRTGEVLDAYARIDWSFRQIQELLSDPDYHGKTYISDFYIPGLDALAYSRKEFQLYSFLWAQTFDRYDFTMQFINWMRPWEVMAFELYRCVFVASDLLKELIVAALPHVEDKVHVVGLPFNSEDVRSKIDPEHITLKDEDKYDVIYTSRWDVEKQAMVFLDLVEHRPDLKFAISTGASELRGTDQAAIYRAQQILNKGGNLTCHMGVSKGVYYALLQSSRVQFNCALQDWVSFTLLEALTFDCIPLYPNFRSFPEALNYNSANLYAPGNILDASRKLDDILSDETGTLQHRNEILDYHNGTLDRIANIIQAD